MGKPFFEVEQKKMRSVMTSKMPRLSRRDLSPEARFGKNGFMNKIVGHGTVGPRARRPMGPRAQGVLVLKTGEADRPKCAFPRPLVVAIVAIVVVAAV